MLSLCCAAPQVERTVSMTLGNQHLQHSDNYCQTVEVLLFSNGPTPASFCLFSFFSPSGIELGSYGLESVAVSTRPPPRVQFKFLPDLPS